MEQMTKKTPEWSKVAEVELIYKSTVKASERPKIESSKDAYRILLQTWDSNKINFQEEFKVLLLNRNSKVIGIYPTSIGGLCGTVADPRLILAVALKTLATGIILSHNHPSGNLKPSHTDEELTLKIKEAAKFHDINVLDHIILTSDEYYSFADEGLL